ncbi:MAG: hypothetical protein KKC80_05610 [Candidatus Margulisbacteria bacterium]|nr:hypothetical protein [Candidatus Margulisiibacteriota bacterium]MBU1617104.1 hypothetical protein [Candidatus Margulisiibacteriota bacterium]
MKSRYYYRLDLLLLIEFLLPGKKFDKIYYFNATPLAKKVIKMFDLGRIIFRYNFCLRDLRGDEEEAIFPIIYSQDLIELVDRIERNVIEKNEFIGRLGEMLGSTDKVRLYFRKHSYNMVHDPTIYLRAIEQESELKGRGQIEYVVPWSPFTNELAAYALDRFGITVLTRYSLRTLCGQLIMLAANLYLIVKMMLLPLFSPNNWRQKVAAKQTVKLSNPYTLKGFSFDLNKRCDFPWLLMLDKYRAQTIMYFEREDVPVNKKMSDQLRENGISAVAMTPKATATCDVMIYRPSFAVFLKSLKMLVKSIFLFIRYSFALRSLDYLHWTMRFVGQYARFYDFFRSNNIKVNIDFIDFDPFRLARQLALRDNGGINVSYQISNWPISNNGLSSGADVMFIFGPYYLPRLTDAGSICGRYIYNGFLTDYAFIAVKERAAGIRRQLVDNGAEFIICYFDENSGDDQMSVLPNARSMEIYKNLLEAVIADKTLGLICSPKRPKTFLKRLPEIGKLVEKAKATGRCIFIDGEYMTDTFPAEPSLAADLTVALLLGGTTALECFLAGSRVVYLDLEKIYTYEEYDWGRGTIIFDSLPGLLAAISEMRQNKDSRVGRQEIIATLPQKDQFRDGKAAKRMAGYLECLLDNLNQGQDREAALAFADEKFRKTWGRDKIINGSD